MLPFSSLTIAICLLAGHPETPLVVVPDPQAALKSESAEQCRARHAQVARARARTVVLVHRGAWDYAPENTLSAIRAALELGASGVELDFRRTRDGVIVLSHDDRLERLLDGVGSIEQSYYEELLLYSFAPLPAPAAKTERVPTLHNVLEVVRDNAGLLHLDIKVPGIDGELLEELRKADMLDHVVTYNDYNSDAFRKAGVAKLAFKGGLMEKDRDCNPREARSMLARPGSMVILDDPRALLTVLGKPPVRISPKALTMPEERPPALLAPLEAALRGTSKQVPARLAVVRLAIFAPGRLTELAAELSRHPSAEVRRALAWNLGMIAKHRPALVSAPVRAVLLHLLRDREIAVRGEAAVACGRARIEAAIPVVVELLAGRPADLDQWTDDGERLRQKRTIIEARARYAMALGLLGVKKPAVIGVLVDAVKHRAVHRDLMLLGVDGAMAARALGRLRAAESVGALRDALFRDDPSLEAVSREHAVKGKPASPPGWWDFQIRSFIPPALAEIGTDEAMAVLETALDARDNRLSPYTRARAADAFAGFRAADRTSILGKLLKCGTPEARRSAILACLRLPDPRCRGLLESAAPWALPWWDVQNRRGEP